jgi:hypothetical protein
MYNANIFAQYTADLTETEWQLIDYCFPMDCPTGRPREHSYRELVNGIKNRHNQKPAPHSRILL